MVITNGATVGSKKIAIELVVAAGRLNELDLRGADEDMGLMHRHFGHPRHRRNVSLDAETLDTMYGPKLTHGGVKVLGDAADLEETGKQRNDSHVIFRFALAASSARIGTPRLQA